MDCLRCWKTNVDVHTCTPTNIARWYEIGEIIKALWDYWKANPDLRFWQLLFNIGYLQFPDGMEWQWVVKDPYNTSDTILKECLDKANVI
jgi:hypothetical protein